MNKKILIGTTITILTAAIAFGFAKGYIGYVGCTTPSITQIILPPIITLIVLLYAIKLGFFENQKKEANC